MRILYIPGSYPFCYYYRGYLPGVYSNQSVISDFMNQNMKYDQKELQYKAENADVLVFQRPTDRKMFDLAVRMKLKGKKIIFENDDTYSAIPLERLGNLKQIELAEEMNQNLNDFLKIADGAIASTQVLADEYRRINPNVTVLKNTIDPMDEWPVKENKTGKFRVGFIGSVTSNDDYEHIKDDIRRLGQEPNVTIVIMGVKFANGEIYNTSIPDYEFWNSIPNIEWHPYCHISEYMRKVADMALDVAVIPRKDHYFNQCKSNLKYLEMSLLKIPVIAQGMKNGAYENDPHMTRVYEGQSWYDAIMEVKYSYPQFKEMAEKAHDYVIESYNINKYAPTWSEEITKLCNYQKTS